MEQRIKLNISICRACDCTATSDARLAASGTGSSWKSNRKSGVALAWYFHLRVHGLRKGDEHLAYVPVEYDHFIFTFK